MSLWNTTALTKFPQKNATFKLLAMSNDEPIFFSIFAFYINAILHIKHVLSLLKLEMALVTTIEVKFALVLCAYLIVHKYKTDLPILSKL